MQHLIIKEKPISYLIGEPVYYKKHCYEIINVRRGKVTNKNSWLRIIWARIIRKWRKI